MAEVEKKKGVKVIAIVVIIVAIILIAIIVIAVKNGNNKENNTNTITQTTKQIEGSEFENIKAKDVNLIYDSEAGETRIQLNLENIGDSEIKEKSIDLIFYNQDDQQLAGISEYIDTLKKGEDRFVEVILLGNVDSISKVILQKETVSEE